MLRVANSATVWRVTVPGPVTTALLVTAVSCAPSEPKKPTLTYPDTARGDVVEDYHGTQVADPYRWMEDLDVKETPTGWPLERRHRTLPGHAAAPEALQRAADRRSGTTRASACPTIEGGTSFLLEEHGAAAPGAHLHARRARGAADAGDRPQRDLRGWLRSRSRSTQPSPDAKLLAYGLAEGGADWRTIKVRDIATGKDLPDEVRWMRFSDISWTKDAKGFFYSRYPEPPKNKVLEAALSGQALYYHRVGTPQSADIARLRAQGPARLADRRHRHRGRPLSADRDGRGLGEPEPALLRGPRATRRRRTCRPR